VPAPDGDPGFAGMTKLRYLIAGVIKLCFDLPALIRHVYCIIYGFVGPNVPTSPPKKERIEMKRNLFLSMIIVWMLMAIGQVSANDTLKSAEKFFDDGDYKKAIDLLKTATEKDPSDTEAWVLLGNSYMRLGKDKNAIEAYEQAIGIEPESENAYLGLGQTYSMMRRHSDAIEAYKKVVQINPKHAEAYFNMGVSYDRSSNLTHAFEQYKILKTLDEDLADRLYHIILGN
jgi:tetratricopeptide (TPR) repeat protein